MFLFPVCFFVISFYFLAPLVIGFFARKLASVSGLDPCSVVVAVVSHMVGER